MKLLKLFEILLIVIVFELAVLIGQGWGCDSFVIGGDYAAAKSYCAERQILVWEETEWGGYVKCVYSDDWIDAPPGTHWENRDDEVFKPHFTVLDWDAVSTTDFTDGTLTFDESLFEDPMNLTFLDDDGWNVIEATWSPSKRELVITNIGNATVTIKGKED